VRPGQPVLVLSSLADPESMIASLSLGADDYVPKPFHDGELLARVQARLRAARRAAPTSLACGPLRLDAVRRQADAGAGPVPLTGREFQLLFELMRRPGTVVSRADLVTLVWRTPPDTTSNVVEVCVRRLRARLGADAITTVRGRGYRVGPPRATTRRPSAL
jgi:DNA-binding response OmpR family regulator